MIRSVAVVLVEDCAVFEFGVLCEVFGIDRTEDGVPAFDFRVCAERPGEPLMTSIGMPVLPTHGLEAVLDADLVAVPAARIRDDYPAPVLEALRTAAKRGAVVLSVCSGAFLLGAAGLLDDRACTTHWRYVAELAERFPRAHIDPDVLFVDDGDLVTSAGTAAGIDACLHLVRREVGTRAATAIARRMVVPPQRDGGQRQFIEQPLPAEAASLQPLLTQIQGELADDHTVTSLARRAAMSERTFARRFLAETGTTPHRWLTTQRVLLARRLLEETTLPIDDVADRCGFGSGALLRHHFRKIVGVPPADYRRSFCGLPRGAAAGA